MPGYWKKGGQIGNGVTGKGDQMPVIFMGKETRAEKIYILMYVGNKDLFRWTPLLRIMLAMFWISIE